MLLTKDQIKPMLQQAQSQGVDPTEVLQDLQQRGYELEGFGQPFTPAPQVEEQKPNVLQRVGRGAQRVAEGAARFLGVGEATKAVGELLSGTERKRQQSLEDAVATQSQIAQQLQAAKTSGQDTTNLMNALQQQSAVIAEIGEQETVTADPVKTAGGFASLGALAVPVGKIAQGVQSGVRAIPAVGSRIGEGAARTLGNIVGGGATGAASDVGINLAETGEAQLGLGTALGAGIPVVGSVFRTISPVVGEVAAELGGVVTGTKQAAIKEAFEAGLEGGGQLSDFRNALRGNIQGDDIVQAMDDIAIQSRSRLNQEFAEVLGEQAQRNVRLEPVRQNFISKLNDFGVSIGEEGLDFTRSQFEFNETAQNQLKKLYSSVLGRGDDIALRDADVLRQAIGDNLDKLTGDKTATRRLQSLLTSVQDDIRSQAVNAVPEYGDLLQRQAPQRELLSEARKVLFTSDANKDKQMRRVLSILRDNNEARKAIVESIEQMSGTNLTAQIAGQQLSEMLPRGLIGVLAGNAVLGSVGGIFSPKILVAAALSSPRVVGEFVSSLGVTGRNAKQLRAGVQNIKNSLPMLDNLSIRAGSTLQQELD